MTAMTAALLIGFGLGASVAAQLGPLSLLAGVGLGSLTWMVILTGGVSLTRRWVGDRMLRVVDALAGIGLLGFGGLLAYRTLRD